MLWNLISNRYEQYNVSHFIMLVIITIYSLFGAICFCLLEKDNELRMLEERNRTQEITKDVARHQLISDLQAGFK